MIAKSTHVLGGHFDCMCPYYRSVVNPAHASLLVAAILALEHTRALDGRGCYLFKGYFLTKDGSTFGRRETFIDF